MTHARVRRRLSAYLEGELGLREEALLEHHLGECAPCAAELRALRRAVELLHTLPAPEPSRDLGAAVIAPLRAGEGQPRRLAPSWWTSAGAGGWLAPFALAMGVGAVLWLGQLGSPADTTRGELALASPLAPRPAAPREARSRPLGAPGGVGIGAPAATAPAANAPLPSIATCLESGSASGCASWDHWWVELALADARRFTHELDGLPASVRERQLRRISEFAARSGSAIMIGDELRRSRDPGAIRYARSFERGRGVGVVQAGWSGR